MMNDTSLQILSTNKSISTQVAKFCRLTSRFCKILSIKTLFKFQSLPVSPKFYLPRKPGNRKEWEGQGMGGNGGDWRSFIIFAEMKWVGHEIRF